MAAGPENRPEENAWLIPLSADFVVVGSGIIGSLVARKLAHAGASVIILEAGPRVTRGELVARFRNSPRRSDWMSPYPPAPWAPHPVYQPQDERLSRAGRALSLPGRIYPPGRRHDVALGGARLAQRPNDFKIKSLYGVGVDWPIEL